MKRFSSILILGVVGLLTGCWETQVRSNSNDPLLRYHFAGMKSALQGTNGTRFQKIWALPETVALREEALTKLARAPFHILQSTLPSGSVHQGALIKPLLDDLLNNEHFAEVKVVSDKLEFVVAIKLPNDRLKVWDANLRKVAGDWGFAKPVPGDLSGPKGWETKTSGGQIAFSRAGDWTVIGFGTVPYLRLFSELVSEPAKSLALVGKLEGALLDLNADLPRLTKWMPMVADYPLAPAHLRVLGNGENLRTEVRLVYSENLQWRSEPWVLPKKAINDPLASFTMGQGFTQILGESKVARALGLKQFPNQFCLWSMQNDFPMTYLAFPVSNSTNFINNLAQTLPREASVIMPNHMGDFFWTSNRAEFSWRNLPFIVPRMYSHSEGNNHFAVTEIYPRPPLTNPPPPELFAEIQSKRNLVYYDWEMSQIRLFHANVLFQLYDIVNNRRPFDTNVVAQRWINSLGPSLGNTITEATMVSAKDIAIIRKSYVGLTAFELVTLARWINSKGFPFEYEPAPMIRKRPANTSNAAPKLGPTPPQGANPPLSKPRGVPGK
jgi:hypothetical protein